MTRVRICKIDGCDRKHFGLGFCQMHHRRFARHGDPFFETRAPAGSGWLTEYGYRMVVVNGHAVREHRQVMSETLGRPLLPTEDVHHINGDRADNRPENLEVVSHIDHGTIHRNLSTHCSHGHPWNLENTGLSSNKRRYCRACHRIWRRERTARDLYRRILERAS